MSTTPHLHPSLEFAYRYCKAVATHYENYPVASFLIQKKLRQPIYVIYAFARYADDIADEGTQSSETRIHALQQLYDALKIMNQDDFNPDTLKEPASIILQALSHVQRHYDLPIGLFQDLISAFLQDVSTSSYETATELLDYCRRSAHPIGRLLLLLHGYHEPHLLHASDGLCTALQLINFIQDIKSDYEERGRLYIPKEDLKIFEIDNEAIFKTPFSLPVQQVIEHQYHRAQTALNMAQPLCQHIKGRFGLEVRVIYACAEKMLSKLRERTTILERPTMKKNDFLTCFIKALWAGFSRKAPF